MTTIPWEDNLSSRQKEITIGCLLGDGRLECRSTSGTARLRIHHAESQMDYLFWKHEEFKDIVLKEPWSVNWFDRRYGKHYISWFFHTKTTYAFRELHRLFYKENIKVIPPNIHELLTPLSLAVWIMDDGCMSDDSLIINTQSFQLEEQEILCRALHDRLNIHATINKDRNNFRLRISKVDTSKLSLLISPHVILSMKNKIVPVTTLATVARVAV